MPPPPVASKLEFGCTSSAFTHAHFVPRLAHWLFLLPVTRTKPGYCPRVVKVVPLHKGCVCDDDCPGNHKCCSVERRDVCVPPAFSRCLSLGLCLSVWLKLGLVFCCYCCCCCWYCRLIPSQIPLPLQKSRGFVLALAGARECVPSTATMIATVPGRRSAAPAAVDISALHHTQVWH